MSAISLALLSQELAPRDSHGFIAIYDIGANRTGLEGVLLGGYYCPRAVLFELRFVMGAAYLPTTDQ